ncbi:MAG: DEAD/DEAH box helicase family protein [Blastocatellia bacterium]|nr:DEAD/DEAH box helicase family protein [Blastocatellia bacterium]
MLSSYSSPFLALRQRRMPELASFFYYSNASVIGNSRLREPQEEAYLAIRRYFSRPHKLPAMVEIPTGCGKTGIIAIAPFRVARGRVLVIAPNLTVRDTIVKSLAYLGNSRSNGELTFYLKCNIFEKAAQLPKVTVLDRQRSNLSDCLLADVVVTNIQQLGSWIDRFSPEFFDLIIVDEAHHVPAESWQRVNQTFPQAKKLYLTATPFRSDGLPIVAKPIYQYPLSRAIQNDYVKNVVRVDAVASKLTFTLEGQTHEFTLDEIAELREEFWFSRGVALSEICNRTIVAASVTLLTQQRQSGVFHQMLAAACSIRHAQQLVELYQTAGLRATYVASQGMTREEREARLQAFEEGRFDCVVHVGILGEGYDHPNVSVAAIFRPYRSLSPYAQFVGRTLRRIPSGGEADNLGYVVGHVGLNLEPLWQEFKSESRHGKFRNFLKDKPVAEHNADDRAEADEKAVPEILNQEITGLDVDVFCPTVALETGYRDAPDESLQDLLAKLAAAAPARLAARWEDEPGATRPGMRVEPVDTQNRPDLERNQVRRELNQEIRRAAGFIVTDLQLADDGSLVALLGENGELTNFEVVIRSLNRELNHLMKKDEHQSNRNDWNIDELRTAVPMVRALRDMLLFKIRLVTGTRAARMRKH